MFTPECCNPITALRHQSWLVPDCKYGNCSYLVLIANPHGQVMFNDLSVGKAFVFNYLATAGSDNSFNSFNYRLKRAYRAIRLLNAIERHVFVAVTRIGVYLLHLLEDDCLLRTVLYAGEAELALAISLHADDALAVHCADVLSHEELQRAGKEADEREHPLQMDAYRAVNQKAASLPDR